MGAEGKCNRGIVCKTVRAKNYHKKGAMMRTSCARKSSFNVFSQMAKTGVGTELTITWLVAYGQFMTTFGAACRKDSTSVFGSHTRTETVNSATADFAGLEGTFHWKYKKN